MPGQTTDPFRALKALTVPTLVLMVLAQAVFASFPGIDLAVSSWFYFEPNGFWMNDVPALQFLREVLWNLVVVTPLACIALVFFGHRIPIFQPVPRHVWGFSTLFILLGPALLVNGIFKAYWGRARPANVRDFGGDNLFTPAFQFADQCAKNCSFVGGEASGLTAMAIVVWLISRNLPDVAWTKWASHIAIVIAVVGSLLRLVKGRHFLSDITIGALMMMLLAILMAHLWQYFRGKRV